MAAAPPNPTTFARQTFTANGNYTVPEGVTLLGIFCVGPGGAGGDTATVNEEAYGGGGGAYSWTQIACTPGQVYAVVVAAGTDTSVKIGATTYCMAKAGTAGTLVARGTGGTAAASTGTLKYSGGDGNGSPGNRIGGGGGGGAGDQGVGTGGLTQQAGGTGGTATYISNPVATGGAGGSSANGSTGVSYGGGGGGAGSTSHTGGPGAPGICYITGFQMAPHFLREFVAM